jgi:hypothetical protein
VGAPVAPVAASVHVPTVALQTSHAPAHAVSQQNPSVQNPVVQTRHPVSLQSAPAASLHTAPWSLRGLQVLSAAQYEAGPHWRSLVQVDAQAVDAPSHAYALHEGDPGEPAGAGEQVPSAAAPRACEQTSHGAEHALAQQTPSTQAPLAQTGQPLERQSAPATGLHALPCGFFGEQVPLDAQNDPAAQPASDAHEVGHAGPPPQR